MYATILLIYIFFLCMNCTFIIRHMMMVGGFVHMSTCGIKNQYKQYYSDAIGITVFLTSIEFFKSIVLLYTESLLITCYSRASNRKSGCNNLLTL